MYDRLDHAMQELAVRMAEMAPPAPPFPEEITLRRQTHDTRSRAWSGLLRVAVVAAVLVLGLALPVLLGWVPGPGEPAPTIEPEPAGPPVGTQTTAPEVTGSESDPFHASLYFYATFPARPETPVLVPVSRTVASRDAMGGAIAALLTGPAPGDRVFDGRLSSAIPTGFELLDLDVDGSLAAVDLTATAPGAASIPDAGLAQLVHTVTQFPTITEVVVSVDGSPLASTTGETQMGRDSFAGSSGPVLLDHPVMGGLVPNPVALAGATAEAVLAYEITIRDRVVAEGHLGSSCGDGCWGGFSELVAYSVAEQVSGEVTVFTLEADGSRQAVLTFPVILSPAATP